MSSFEEARFIFTQDLNDDRGVAFAKYVLDPMLNPPRTVGSTPIVGTVIVDFNKNYNFPNVGIKTPNEVFSTDQLVWVDFFEHWGAYIELITSGNAANNIYTKNFINEYNSISDPKIKKMYEHFFNIDPDIVYRNTTNFLDMFKKFRSVTQDPQSNLVLGFKYMQKTLTNNSNDYQDAFNSLLKLSNLKFWPGLNTMRFFTNKFKSLHTQPQTTEEEDEEDTIAGLNLTPDSWYRKKNAGEYIYYRMKYTQDPNPEYEAVELDLTNSGKCGELNFDDNDCNTVLSIITLQDNQNAKDRLRKYLDNPSNRNVWQDIKHSIEENLLHPKLVLSLLNRFGFEVKTDEPKICSVTYWLKNIVAKHFNLKSTDALTNTIRTNDKLIKFLQYLVAYINCNPGLLDPEYITTNVSYRIEDVDEIPQWCKDFGIEKKKRVLRQNMDNLSNLVRIAHNSFGANPQDSARRLRKNTEMYFGNIFPLFNNAMGLMNGGNPYAVINPVIIDGTSYSLSGLNGQGNEKCYEFFSETFQTLLREAKKRNMILSEKDRTFIQRQLDNLKTYQHNLIKRLSKIANIIINNPKSYDTQQTINLNSYLDNFENKAEKYYNQNQKLMRTLNKVIARMMDENYLDALEKDISNEYGYKQITL